MIEFKVPSPEKIETKTSPSIEDQRVSYDPSQEPKELFWILAIVWNDDDGVKEIKFHQQQAWITQPYWAKSWAEDINEQFRGFRRCITVRRIRAIGPEGPVFKLVKPIFHYMNF